MWDGERDMTQRKRGEIKPGGDRKRGGVRLEGRGRRGGTDDAREGRGRE